MLFKREAFFIFILPGFNVFAASGGEIPFSFIGFQAFNFSIFVSIIAFLLIKKSGPLFEGRRRDYLAMKKKAENLYNEALKETKALEEKELKLKKDEDNFLNLVKKQADAILKKEEKSAHERSLFILKMAEDEINQEWARAKMELKTAFLDEVEKGVKSRPPQSSLESLYLYLGGQTK